ncbi:hypothetical protein [uncultured Aeromicrobium sp.]|uniref:hypothetical protein n=1 Tax=uncultured Aeromicrobium sp. TaxID=337820 RepID=UPI0025D1BF27|nr:hypothetical protein [uncultured Aeromicrobium sp.]
MATASLSTTACIIACTVLGALLVVQICVAAGAPWGRLVWGGQHRVLPNGLRVGSALSVPLYAGFAGVLLSRAGLLPGGNSLPIPILTWVLCAYFAVGIAMNGISRSRAERFTMTPACAVLAAATLVVALS